MMYALQDRYILTITRYLWWLIFENIAISLLYTIFTITLFPKSGVHFPDVGVRALGCVTIILTIPNVIILFYAAYRAKCEELEATQYQLQRLGEEYRLLESSKEHEIRAVVNSSNIVNNSKGPTMISLYDNNNILRLTINVDSLYYLESEDNYIKVHYKHNDKITSYMLRCRTRSVEKSLEGTCMVRCHRSFMVNVVNINHIRKEGKSRYIVLTNNSIKPIPVSKSYFKNLIEKIDNCNTSILAKQQKSSEATEPTSEV